MIDFVVEEELSWFCGQVDSDAQIKYVVLLTDKEHLTERLEKRNEIKYLDRSLVLLEKLSSSPEYMKYSCDTTGKEVSDIRSI